MEENKSNEIISKLISTQHVMRNKFKNAYANRLEGEHNLNQSLEPLIISSPTSINESKSMIASVSLRNISKTKNNAPQLRLATKSYPKHSVVIKSQPMTTALTESAYSENVEKSIPYINIEKNANNNNNCLKKPNALRDRLRLLLSTQIAGNSIQVEEINIIITQLRELNILA